MKAHLVAIASGLAVVSTAAPAQSVADVRCLIVSNVFNNTAKEDKAKHLAQTSSAFYLGHLDRFSPAQLRRVVDAQKKSLSGVQLGPIMNDCVKRLEASGQMINGVMQAAPAKPAK